MQPPQTDPLLIGSQNLLLLRLRIPHLGLQDPIGPTGLAVILLVPVSIPSVLDDVHTPASTAPVNPSLLNHGTPPREDSLYDTSLTKRSPPTTSEEVVKFALGENSNIRPRIVVEVTISVGERSQ
jgi:hypothetical protein